ncbi:Hemerythrin HHE cation binding domain protein [Caloramator mitchellensis]|uniref:Hemerythrin HHE cation binding domain protein n=1 Tax=Caloramator mitchellensis TaxID=908809 RepID=A0A0R3JVK5_CALMK|nr:DUF438 domain-containing protein [Caloramator mitchellensis]KRQ87607.1 Hemerythrin HHE cation binding domain protein [Caloramator mitchellensis]
MSEMINNREYRQKVLKELIMELHDGKPFEEVKAKFEKIFSGVAATEISEMEQALIMEGMPVTEVQRLCDVHAAIFKGTIEEIHKPNDPKDIPGHPVNTFFNENRAIEKVLDKIRVEVENFKRNDSNENALSLVTLINELWDIDKHYLRKENLIFPYLEKYGITAPPKVMWGVDDEIRGLIKESKRMLVNYEGNKDEVVAKIDEMMTKVDEMIFKEENILFPMTVDTFTEDEWVNIMEESDEIGFCLVEPIAKWVPERVNVEKAEKEDIQKGYVKFDTGILSIKELSTILNTLPFDITFIDKDDVVKYFSQGKERIFARTKAVIGRTVQNCHPPASVHIVNKMLSDFKEGRKDHEDFWINMGKMYVYIRYFAVRDENGEYLGTLEVTQNIKPIKELEGEKRILN